MEGFETLWGHSNWADTVFSLLILAAAVSIGVLIHQISFALTQQLARRTGLPWDNLAVGYARRPARLLLPLFALHLVMPLLRLPLRGQNFLKHLASLLLILAVAYAFVSLVHFARDYFLARYSLQANDNLTARKVHTQVGVLEKLLIAAITVITIACMLMTFDGVRQIGVSLLASAGIAGIVLGFAAQKSLATLLAGIQIALSQPIRVDDVVIVENEWGRVEEITLTFVVVRIWDLRRLVLPITYFIEKPFQNWTRVSADLLGTVFLYTDYTVPVEAVRAEVDNVVKAHPYWDGKVCLLQVTESRADALELRILLSTRNSGEGFDMRCDVRERMVAFLQREYPAALPRTRVEVSGSGMPSAAPSGGTPG